MVVGCTVCRGGEPTRPLTNSVQGIGETTITRAGHQTSKRRRRNGWGTFPCGLFGVYKIVIKNFP